MATKAGFGGLLLGMVLGGCYSDMSTEGLRCIEDAACNAGQICSYQRYCRVACNIAAGGPECQANPESAPYGCWEDTQSATGGSCLPCGQNCGAGCCPGDWICGVELGICCPPWRPNVCPNATCGATPEDCTPG